MEELKQKYFILKQDDISEYLSEKEMYSLHDISTKISDAREVKGRKHNQYVVLNLEDEIDLSPWSPIIKRIEEIEESHLIELSKKGASTRRCVHDKKSDHVKDIVCSILCSIKNGNPWRINNEKTTM